MKRPAPTPYCPIGAQYGLGGVTMLASSEFVDEMNDAENGPFQ